MRSTAVATIPSGDASFLYLDTQFAFAYLVPEDPDHEAARALAGRLAEKWAEGKAVAIISIMTVSELAWSLAGAMYDRRFGPGAWRTTDRSHSFSRLRADVAKVINTFIDEDCLILAGAPGSAVKAFAAEMTSRELAPADLSHLVIACASGADALVTNDRHFHRLRQPPVEIIGYAIE